MKHLNTIESLKNQNDVSSNRNPNDINNQKDNVTTIQVQHGEESSNESPLMYSIRSIKKHLTREIARSIAEDSVEQEKPDEKL